MDTQQDSNTGPLSFGQRAVAITPLSDDPTVCRLKDLYAQVIDVLYTARTVQNIEKKNTLLFRVAIEQAILAQMAAVRAVTGE